MKMRFGAEKDGRLHPVLADIIAGKGPGDSASGKPTLTRALQQITDGCRILDVGGIAQEVFTNNATGGAMMGPGSIQPNFAIESMMDVLADKMRMDCLEIGIMNVKWGLKSEVGSCNNIYSQSTCQWQTLLSRPIQDIR